MSNQLRDARRRITYICATLAGLMNLLAQLSDRIHYFTVYKLMPTAFLTKPFNMH